MNFWDSLFHLDVPLFSLLIRAVVVYLGILILLRISGKKQMGQMGATEFVAILLISNAVQNAMNGGDNSLAGGLFLAVILIGLSSAISILTYRSRFFRRLFEGTPTVLIRDGKLLKANLHKEKLSENELKTLLRKQGIHHLNDIATAILEADGSLSVTKSNEL